MEKNVYSYKHNAFKGKVMGIFTSGGDSPGMNATLRTCVRTAIYYGIKIFIIREGYQGMINGDEDFIDGNWMFVSNIIHLGGTIIGSARCKEFRTRPGRLKAAYNLVIRNITHLIVIGGDGSLTGANLFREEWKSLLEELLENGKINAEQKQGNEELFIVGLVGSIDNDFCGTDMTIGTDSALHRIMEAYESIHSTAHSHQRAFVFEVMGRKCGYLALCTALATEADYLFIPESPPSVEWRDQLCDKINQALQSGQRLKLIIVAEGAIDCECTPITSEQIKDVLVARLNLDVRVQVLGHVQRGGNPSAFDRILASRMGFEAVVALAEAVPGSESIVISLDRNHLRRLSLMESVRLTNAVSEAISAKDFETAINLRGPSYKNNLEIFRLLTRINPPKVDNNSLTGETITGYRLAVMHIGSPSSGMNAAVRSFTRNCLYRGHHVFAIHDGIKGLLVGDIQEMGWYTVSDWVGKGGALIGSKRLQPEDKFKQIAERFKEFNIQGLLIIGGFDAYTSCGQLFEERLNYPEFCIPMIVVPTTINNNVPGAEFTLGSDTALNIITEICDRLRQSAQGTRQRVFIIETMGEHCGYLATLAGLASAVDATYIYEEKFTIRDLANDVENLKTKIEAGVPNGLVLRTEQASENYSTDFINRVYSEEGKDIFTCKMSIIGHMQQGGLTTPFDRNLGTKLGAKCIDWFVDQLKKNTRSDGSIYCTDNESACVLGAILREHKFTPLAQLLPQTDFKHRMPKEQWWLKLRPILKILTDYESAFDK